MKLIKYILIFTLCTSQLVIGMHRNGPEIRRIEVQPEHEVGQNNRNSPCSWRVACGIFIFSLIATYVDRYINSTEISMVEQNNPDSTLSIHNNDEHMDTPLRIRKNSSPKKLKEKSRKARAISSKKND